MEYPERIVEFAFCPRPCYQYLADLADPEDWGEDGRVLVNYIDFTYRRAAELMRRQGACGSYIVVDGEAACLDTGLFTSRFEEIYALFERNSRPDAQPWFLKGFYKASDTALAGIDVLPERVHYAENPADLVYDFHLAVRPNIDHILGDENNLLRVPEALRGSSNARLLRRVFEGAIAEAERKAAANYTIAVPQYYNGRIQLLLPLCLTGDMPELALTIQREEGFYSARTCLTLEMAYNNARQICRPMDAAMAQTMTASSAPLRASVDQSPARPSWMEPTMAMAPMQTVSDAVTNPSTKCASPELPVLSRNHVPRVSKRASRSSSSPATVPRASEMSIVIVPCVPRVMVPSAAAVATSMCCSVPAAPTKMTHTPHARSRALWRRSVTSELARSPMVPPPTMQATFMSVPRPIMGLPALVRWRLAAL